MRVECNCDPSWSYLISVPSYSTNIFLMKYCKNGYVEAGQMIEMSSHHCFDVPLLQSSVHLASQPLRTWQLLNEAAEWVCRSSMWYHNERVGLRRKFLFHLDSLCFACHWRNIRLEEEFDPPVFFIVPLCIIVIIPMLAMAAAIILVATKWDTTEPGSIRWMTKYFSVTIINVDNCDLYVDIQFYYTLEAIISPSIAFCFLSRSALSQGRVNGLTWN